MQLNSKKEENKKNIFEDFNLNEKNLLKENIKNILEKRKNKNISCSNNNSKYNKTNIYNDNKLKKLLSKIPNHNNDNKAAFKQYPDYFKITTKNNFNIIDKYEIRKNSIKGIMPPNNLEDIILKKKIDFLNNFN